MKRYFIYMLAAAVLAGNVSCNDDPEIHLIASFTTDKEVYDVGDQVIITNTTVVSNAQVAICKWEYQGNVSYDETLTGLVYAEAGEYTVKLTVTADMGAKKDSFEKTITVVDNNIRPVADFSYYPTEVTAGEEVQFTDLSTDEDGYITKWEWKFGSGSSTEQNPKYTFTEGGDVEVSLTVTDDKLGTNTKSVTISVARGADGFELLWSSSYDDTSDAYVFGTSPAVSHDGEFVYVTSTGYHLVCFTKDGVKQWSFDLNPDGRSSALGGYSDTPVTKRNPHPTPSVDADGTVFAAVGYNFEDTSSSYSSFLYAVTGGGSGGTRKWSTDEDPKGHMTFFSPAVTDNYVMMAYRNGTKFGGAENSSAHLQVYDKSTGAPVFAGHCNSGSRGGLMAMKDGKIIAGVGGHWGYRLYFPNGTGSWRFGPDNATGSNNHNLGCNSSVGKNGNPYSSQPASGPGGKVYLLMRNHNDGDYFTNATGGNAAVVYYESISDFEYGVAPADPTWTRPLKGNISAQNYGETGNGIAVGTDGTVYATTTKEIQKYEAPDYEMTFSTAYDSYLTAINADGSVKWEHKAEGNIQGVPAIDDQGFVYYNDAETGKLVKVNPTTGNTVASITLGENLRSSPTVSYDGTLYVTGMKDGKPTVWAVSAGASGCAQTWSQLGGNPSKTACMF